MAVFQPTYTDPKTGRRVKSATWWYDFNFAGKRIREPAETTLKTLARMAEQSGAGALKRASTALRTNATNASGRLRNWRTNTSRNTGFATKR